MQSFLNYLNETVGSKGLQYELKVHTAMKSAKIRGLNVGDKPGAGFSNQGAGDIEATYNGKPFNIEIKASAKDQMGGGSFRYDMASGVFSPVGDKFDPDDLDVMFKAANSKRSAINDYIKAARKTEPTEFTKHISGVPIKVSTEARGELKKQGLTGKIATNIKMSTKFIVNHYNKKGVYYIQVGGAGLFYMGKNPLRLDVPELKAEVQVEMGLRFAGSKLFFNTEPEKTPARAAGLRLQGRMLTKAKSKYSLDNADDLKKLFPEGLK